ncbi:LIM domain kinase 1, partial [Dissostichus eleginoides]
SPPPPMPTQTCCIGKQLCPNLLSCSEALHADAEERLCLCCECSASLSHWYYEKEGRLFCKKDYWAKFGELCHGCNDPITTGLIMLRAESQPMGAGPDIDLDLLHFNSPTEDSGLTVSHPHYVIFATTLCNQPALHTP